MANSDYTVRGSGPIAASALLANSLSPGDTTTGLIDYAAPDGSIPAVGASLMIGNEILRVTSVAMPQLGLARGCADTIPSTHPFGEIVWFLDDSVGTDRIEHGGTETVGVKVLMQAGGGSMGPQNAPPNALTFNRRFARPYPPGNVKVNGEPFWTAGFVLTETSGPLVITWAHRDRLLQGDQLFGHDLGNIGPEPGTTYTLRVYSDENTIAATYAGITGTTHTYTYANALAHFGGAEGVRFSHITLSSVRDGLESYYEYRIDFAFEYAGGALAFRAFRIKVTRWVNGNVNPGNALVRLTNFKVIDASTDTALPDVAMTSNTTPYPLVATASSEYAAGSEAWRAFDGQPNNNSSRWMSAEPSAPPQWLEIDFGPDAEIVLGGVILASDENVSTPSQNYIVDFEVEGTNTPGVYTGANVLVRRTGLTTASWLPAATDKTFSGLS
jgi:hypothetical protein